MNNIYTIPFGFTMFPPIIDYSHYPDYTDSYDDYDDDVDYIELDEFNTTAFDS